MPISKHLVPAIRTGVSRTVEDWRKDKSHERQGPWAVHCIAHGTRRFFPAYAEAKTSAEYPMACHVCLAYDRRCVHCPSNPEQWKADSTSGFTPSVGRLAGAAVCDHHKYGRIPPGIDYLQVLNVVSKTPETEIFLGAAFTGMKAFSVSFLNGDQQYWMHSHLVPQAMSEQSANDYLSALQFATNLLKYLNASLTPAPRDVCNFYAFEPWEAVDARIAARAPSSSSS